jgi:hypothetical protein
VGVRTNVTVRQCGDAAMTLNQLLHVDRDRYTTVISHDTVCKRLLMSMAPSPNVDVNMLISLDTIAKEHRVRLYCENEDMLTEMCPCSVMSSNMIRVVPRHEVANVESSRLMYRCTSMSMFSKVAWYSHMIRSMSLGSMCYDCTIALMLARSMMLALTGVAMDEGSDESRDWRSGFYRIVEQQPDVD